MLLIRGNGANAGGRHSFAEAEALGCPHSSISRQTRHALLLVLSAAVLCGIVSCSSTSARSKSDYSCIASCCADLLRSARTNETMIAPEDPRVPPGVRELNPQQILLAETAVGARNLVVIVRAGRPSVYECWFRGSYPHTVMLFAAGPGYKQWQEVWSSP